MKKALCFLFVAFLVMGAKAPSKTMDSTTDTGYSDSVDTYQAPAPVAKPAPAAKPMAAKPMAANPGELTPLQAQARLISYLASMSPEQRQSLLATAKVLTETKK